VIFVQDIKQFLDEKVAQYNQPVFITGDPIQVPHAYSLKEDIEIAAFLTATIAWGKRKSIIANANRLLGMMRGGPYHFIMEHEREDLDPFLGFVHRTFNGIDCLNFMEALQRIYREHGGLERVYTEGYGQGSSVYDAHAHFRSVFFGNLLPGRTGKHLSDVTSNSAAKRLNMFLRWMVRKDDGGVDFGIWEGIPASGLMIPLDVHTGNSARKLGLLLRKQNDWKAVEELSGQLRIFDPSDPVKYDYALFGLGVYEKF